MSEESSNIEIISPSKSINLDEVQNKIIENNNETENIYKTTENKAILIRKIENYETSRFRDRILAKYPDIFSNLISLNEEQLTERFRTLELYRKTRNNNKSINFLWSGICVGYENITKLCGYQTEGLAGILSYDEECLDTVEDLRLKYFANTNIEPEYRLIFSLLTTTKLLHDANKRNIKNQDQLKESINNSDELKKLLK